ncbi:MAG: hypothetical protein RIQ60_32 [Pseudomonadota bacterium]|jgi:FKBP-type peptidyl-prolyl cis-trans isomerase FklB
MRRVITSPAQPAPLSTVERQLRGTLVGSAIALVGLTLGGTSLMARAADAPAPARAPAAASSSPVAPVATGSAFKSDDDRNGYATGLMTARNLLNNKVPFNAEMIIQGLRDGLAGGAAVKMSEHELRQVVTAMQSSMERHLTQERQAKALANADRGQAFQDKYRQQPGVIVLPGNVMYRILKAGDGDKASENSKIVVKYTGSLVDGTVFDATPEGQTSTFKLSELIPGWKTALEGMPTGAVWEVVIPPALAYGSRGNTRIGPNETLMFKVELVALAQ